MIQNQSADKSIIPKYNYSNDETLDASQPLSEKKLIKNQLNESINNMEEKQILIKKNKYPRQQKIVELQQLKIENRKQEELIYIYKSQFKKLEEVFYGNATNVLDQKPLDYEKTQMVLRDIVSRASKLKGKKPLLPSPPLIYKKRNVKTYSLSYYD